MSNITTSRLHFIKRYQPIIGGGYTISIEAIWYKTNFPCQEVIATTTIHSYEGMSEYRYWVRNIKKIITGRSITFTKCSFERVILEIPKVRHEIKIQIPIARYYFCLPIENSSFLMADMWIDRFEGCLAQATRLTDTLSILDNGESTVYYLDDETKVMLLLKYGS